MHWPFGQVMSHLSLTFNQKWIKKKLFQRKKNTCKRMSNFPQSLVSTLERVPEIWFFSFYEFKGEYEISCSCESQFHQIIRQFLSTSLPRYFWHSNSFQRKEETSKKFLLCCCKIFSKKYFQIFWYLFHCKMVVKRKIIFVDRTILC